MPRNKVHLEHPMSADRMKKSPARNSAKGAQDLFDKLDSGEIQPEEEEVVEPSPEEAKKIKSLKELLFFGNLTRSVEIDGFHFRLRSLNHKESRDITKRILLMSDEEKLVESNILHVAASLDRINGFSISEAYSEILEEDGEDLSDIDKNLELLSQLNNHLVGKLIEEYFNLSSDSRDFLKKDPQDIKK